MADKTAKFESAQALFCAIADLVGKHSIENVLNVKKYPTYEEFEKGKWYNKTNRKRIDEAAEYIDTTADLDVIEEFLKENKDWYTSSVKIAKKLINTLGDISLLEGFKGIANPKFLTGQSAVHYFRGDADVMDKIQGCFAIANANAKWLKAAKQTKFGDINKWSPADIYYASLSAKTAISKELADAQKDPNGYNFGKLNNFVNGEISKGQLLPLSLKKQTKNVTIKKINFEIAAREKMINGAWNKDKLEGGLWYHSTEPYEEWRGNCGTTLTSWHHKRQKFSPFEPEKGGKYGYDKSPTRDVRINVADRHGGPKVGNIQVRHDASNNGFKAEFKYDKAMAKEGGISSWQGFGDVLEVINNQAGRRFKNNFFYGTQTFNTQMVNSYTNPAVTHTLCCPNGKPKGLEFHKPIIQNDWKRLYKVPNAAGGLKDIATVFPSGDSTTGAKTPYTNLRGEVSTIAVTNRFAPALIDWINSWKDHRDKPTDTTQVDEFIRLIFRYMTVQSTTSGKFVIAK